MHFHCMFLLIICPYTCHTGIPTICVLWPSVTSLNITLPPYTSRAPVFIPTVPAQTKPRLHSDWTRPHEYVSPSAKPLPLHLIGSIYSFLARSCRSFRSVVCAWRWSPAGPCNKDYRAAVVWHFKREDWTVLSACELFIRTSGCLARSS